MKRINSILLLIAVIMLACVFGACAKAPADGPAAPSAAPTDSPIEPTAPASTVPPEASSAPVDVDVDCSLPDFLYLDYSSYAELASAITDNSTENYRRLHGYYHSPMGPESLGSAYNEFIAGVESGKINLPLPLFDGEIAELAKPESSIYVSSEELLFLPVVSYLIECDGQMISVSLTPLMTTGKLSLTGSETYSDIAKILAPGYPTEDTPKEQYTRNYTNVTGQELELAGGRKVWATVLERELGENSSRIDYNFVYGDYVVSVWEWISPGDGSSAQHLPDWFFEHFSLGGSITDML